MDTIHCHFFYIGDGKLSYREFMAVMKNWKLRGFKVIECLYICLCFNVRVS